MIFLWLLWKPKHPDVGEKRKKRFICLVLGLLFMMKLGFPFSEVFFFQKLCDEGAKGKRHRFASWRGCGGREGSEGLEGSDYPDGLRQNEALTH